LCLSVKIQSVNVIIVPVILANALLTIIVQKIVNNLN